jgi:hypothetical protein
MFGCLYPRGYCESNAVAERWKMQTQCLVEGSLDTQVEAEIRFLHLVERRVAQLAEPSHPHAGEGDLVYVDALEVDGELRESWQEAVERQIAITPHAIGQLVKRCVSISFTFPYHREVEELLDAEGTVVGAIIREQSYVNGMIELSAAQIADGLISITVAISNTTVTSTDSPEISDDGAARLHSFVSTHTILACDSGQFVSLIDSPTSYRESTSQLQNDGTWPVLVGAEGTYGMMLSSPIILYDYPQVAAESSGDHFDATEIDEMLALRVMTMTEDEKRRMGNVDDRAREILRRTELMPEQQLEKLHGAIRGLRKL